MAQDTLPLYIRKIDQVNEIITYLYTDHSDRREKYKQYLRMLQKIIYFDFGNVVFFWDNKGEYDLEFFCQIGWPEKIEKMYTEHYYKEDDVFPIFGKKTPVIMRSSDMFDDTRTVSSYYASFMLPATFDLSLECNIIFPPEKNIYGICSLFRNFPKSDFSAEESKVLEIIQPHLSCSVQNFFSKYREVIADSTSSTDPLFGEMLFNHNGEIFLVSEEFKTIFYRYSTKHDYDFQKAARYLLNRLYDRDKRDVHLYKLPETPILAELQETQAKDQRTYLICRIYDMNKLYAGCLSDIEASSHLSKQESDILQLMLQGLTREEIAGSLLYSVPSVKKHVSSIYSKLDVKNIGGIFNKIGFL